MSSMPTIVAYGEVLWDLLPAGPVLGGAPFNFAYRVNSFGYRGMMISQLGRDTLGDQAMQQMTALTMDTSYMQRAAQYPTGTVQITLKEDKSPDFTILPEVAYDYIACTPEMNDLVRQAQCLYFGTLIQRSGVSRATLHALLNHFSGQHVLYDINLRRDCYTPEIIKASLERSTILKLNDQEIETVAGLYGQNKPSLKDFVELLFNNTTLTYCLVTLGARGAFAASRSGETAYAPAYRIEVVDTCGAGDAFTAGFAYALLEQQSLRDACQLGNALGAMVAEQPGATQPIAPEAIRAFMRERETVEFVTNQDFMNW